MIEAEDDEIEPVIDKPTKDLVTPGSDNVSLSYAGREIILQSAKLDAYMLAELLDQMLLDKKIQDFLKLNINGTDANYAG